MTKQQKKIKYLKFYSTKFLAKYLHHSEEFLLSVQKKQLDFYSFEPDVPIKGKKRDLYIPSKPLEIILRKIDSKILDRIALPDTFQGGFKGNSPRTNAEPHIGHSEILKVDIRKFFPSTPPVKVFAAFKSLKMTSGCAKLLTDLVTVQKPNPHLPQGFVTSPKIAALVLRGFEHRLHSLAVKFGWSYTFWVDDITISGNFPVGKFKNLIIKMLLDEGFVAHPDKIDVLKMDVGDRMIVTGVVVNKFTNIPKEKRGWISKALHFILKFGAKDYLKNKGVEVTESNIDHLKNKLMGNIHYALGINQALGQKYKKQFCMINWQV